MFSDAWSETERGNTLTALFSATDKDSGGLSESSRFDSIEFIPSDSFNTSEIFTMSNEFLRFIKLKPVADSILGYILASFVLAGMFIAAFGRLLSVEMALGLRAQKLKRAEERRQKRLDERKCEEDRQKEELRRMEEEEKSKAKIEAAAAAVAAAAVSAAAKAALDAENSDDVDPYVLDDDDYWGDEFYDGDETVEERKERLQREAQMRFAQMTPPQKRTEMQITRQRYEREIARRSMISVPRVQTRAMSKRSTLWDLAESRKSSRRPNRKD
jgi:hypothetical protein